VLLLEAGVEIDRRIDRATVLLRALDEDGVGLDRVVAQRQVAAVPFDQAEGHVHDRELAGGGLQLPRAHELHLHR